MPVIGQVDFTCEVLVVSVPNGPGEGLRGVDGKRTAAASSVYDRRKRGVYQANKCKLL
jgi:hypothetical protein